MFKEAMNKRPLATVALVTAFGLLWAPFGQHEFLISHWMKVGTFMAPFLLLVAFVFEDYPEQKSALNRQLVSVIMLIAYIAHQFEEHWIDLAGNEYAFYGYVNDLLRGAVGAPASAEILTPAAIFVINTSLVWLVGALAILQCRERLFPYLCMASIILVNAVSHIVSALSTMSYNPGVATSALIFLPVALMAFSKAQEASRSLIIASIAWAVFAHFVMIAGTIGASWARVFPETFYFAALVLTSLMPTFLCRKATT